MNKYIVITTISCPTKAVKAFSQKKGYHLVVVGDRKTPKGWTCPGAEYLSVETQQRLGYRLVRKLPYDHYSRKMFGYLHAIANGADVIVDTDDDNIPKPGWVFPERIGTFDCIDKEQGFVNIYAYFTLRKIWPRGFPLNLIQKSMDPEHSCTHKKCRIGVWQGLADGDPDVDAIYRLTNTKPCNFKDRPPLVLEKGSVCPFNSQNTQFFRELFPLLYLPCTVSFRFTDILRGLVAQPIMWAYGYRTGFVKATVKQERNEHDLIQDLASELSVYKYAESIPWIASGVINKSRSLNDNLYEVYCALERKKIVKVSEMLTLKHWLKDIEQFHIVCR